MKNELELLDNGTVKLWLQQRTNSEQQYTLISFASLAKLRDWRYPWYVAQMKNGPQVVSGAYNSGLTYLARYITDSGEGQEVFHVNGDMLDNRLCNLVVLTSSQRSMLQQTTSNTGVRGVSVNRRGKFVAMPTVQRKPVYLGQYDRLQDAATAVKEWRMEQLPQRVHHLI